MDYIVSSSRILRDSQNNSRGVGFARSEIFASKDGHLLIQSTALNLVMCARRLSESSMVSLLATRAFFCKSVTPILLHKRILSVSRLNADNSEPTSTMLVHMVAKLRSLPFRLQCRPQSFLGPLRLLVTCPSLDPAVPGSVRIPETCKLFCKTRALDLLTLFSSSISVPPFKDVDRHVHVTVIESTPKKVKEE